MAGASILISPKAGFPTSRNWPSASIALITEDHPVSFRWISDAEMEANQHLIRTMSVKPPMGTGRVRLVMIGPEGSVDLQPCGGTHVRSTGEIGPIASPRSKTKAR